MCRWIWGRLSDLIGLLAGRREEEGEVLFGLRSSGCFFCSLLLVWLWSWMRRFGVEAMDEMDSFEQSSWSVL